MKLTVRFFASIREALGSTETIDVPADATVGSVRDALIARGGVYAKALARDRALRRTTRCAATTCSFPPTRKLRFSRP